ncbi:DNA repair protein RadA [Anaerococcus sp. Marseille-P3625]|uniref:DNA repair protein RadA n=1 Tax=Anaerococcus sp. Marseille-P3625 TaxID=1977277 RepID=UPI000C08B2C1|nr:DNA repair protein RadA [Anaerococcus sp. Marseille-P3625]
MAKIKKAYQCTNCGHSQGVWAGQCPSCKKWGSLVEVVVKEEKNQNIIFEENKAKKLKSIEVNKDLRIKSSYKEFDRVMGDGLIRDSVSILTARPGAGKSTLLLQLSKSYADMGLKVLYVSGEESESQIKSRADRIMAKLPENVWILSTNSMDQAISEIKKIDADIVFLDSIQTFSLREFDNKQGSPTQTIEVANKAVEIAKDPKKKRAIIMIGHMTKANEMAGLRTLEHLVDTVLILDGESDEDLRVLTTSKNRFGRTGEIGLFSMTEDGLLEISNPSQYFISQRDNDVEGSAIAVTKEGSRLLEVEIESLVSKSFLPYPQRIGDSLRKDELNTLISILQERAGLNLFDYNVIIKTTGGLKLSEPSVNLAIMVSIASSFLKKSVSDKTVFIAEVGLTGELKKVPQIRQRLKELERLGYEKCFIAKNSLDVSEFKSLKVIELANIREVLEALFG